MDNIIRELPQDIAEKISAGEVVNRPLSAVKELIENSLDAGSKSIIVEIKNGGKSMIRVTDDGSGIASWQTETAFKRHATSKISSVDDLERIRSLGFRGEALTSIAAVSKLELITKTRDEKTGTLIRLEGGGVVEKKTVGTADGTTVIVSELFYNTPARLKFMKPDRTESALIVEKVSQLALAYPHVRIRLINNGAILFSTPGKGDLLANILTVYGKDTGGGLLAVNDSNEHFSLTGYLSPPSKNRSSKKGQVFFINGRSVTSKTLERAVTEGYRETLFEGRYPIVFMFLEVPPDRLDVNIHPAKDEVRFDDENEVEAFVAEAVRKAIMVKESIPLAASVRKPFTVIQKTEIKETEDKHYRSDANADARMPADAAPTPAGDANASVTPAGDVNASVAPAGDANASVTSAGDANASVAAANGDGETKGEQIDIINLLSAKRAEQAQKSGIFTDSGDDTYSELYSNSMATSHSKGAPFDILSIKPISTIFSTYITGMDSDNFFFIDQHAAHERVLYERFLAQYRRREKLIQQLIAPLVVEVSVSAAGQSSESLEVISRLGYDIEVFGVKSFNIRGIPAFLSISEAEEFLRDLLENLSLKEGAENKAAIERVISNACKKAIKANDKLTEAQINTLLAELAKCENPYSCPHGRPVFLRLGKRDIERLFKRV
ncbi:MAG: DNA mismatch repair endonuclease MutL [Clostridiales Family XIII bacterium]|jgi:DNA mismatch repair protein MutL|nr:DNA mismatch repair endonuclease MutL [Clostridiales Family XIII bacterium]